MRWPVWQPHYDANWTRCSRETFRRNFLRKYHGSITVRPKSLSSNIKYLFVTHRSFGNSCILTFTRARAHTKAWLNICYTYFVLFRGSLVTLICWHRFLAQLVTLLYSLYTLINGFIYIYIYTHVHIITIVTEVNGPLLCPRLRWGIRDDNRLHFRTFPIWIKFKAASCRAAGIVRKSALLFLVWKSFRDQHWVRFSNRSLSRDDRWERNIFQFAYLSSLRSLISPECDE